MRDALFRGMTRFSEFERSLGIAPNILTKRLNAFVSDGLLEHRQSDHPGEASHYIPTRKGLELKPIIIALTDWGDRWSAPHGRPVDFQHDGCGGRLKLITRCSRCGGSPEGAEILAVPFRTRKGRS